MQVDESLTRRVADLARLELTPAELTQFTQQLSGVLEYVAELSEVDVTGVEPLTQPFSPEKTPLREDVAREFEIRLGPGGYRVPQIVSSGGQ